MNEEEVFLKYWVPWSLKLSPTYEDALTWKNKSLVLLLAKINSTNLRVEDGGVVNVIDVNLEGDGSRR